MKKPIITSIVAVILICTVLFNLTGCIMVSAVDLMDGIEANSVNDADLNELNASVTDFAIRMFAASACCVYVSRV